jgi:hypothetical protein
MIPEMKWEFATFIPQALKSDIMITSPIISKDVEIDIHSS